MRAAWLPAVALALAGLAPSAASAHRGHSHAAPWQACEAAALDDACLWETRDGTAYIGTCRSMSEALVCVRNQPIRPPATRRAGRDGWGTTAGLALVAGAGLLLFRRFV